MLDAAFSNRNQFNSSAAADTVSSQTLVFIEATQFSSRSPGLFFELCLTCVAVAKYCQADGFSEKNCQPPALQVNFLDCIVFPLNPPVVR